MLQLEGDARAHLLAGMPPRYTAHPPAAATRPPLPACCRALPRRQAGACPETALRLWAAGRMHWRMLLSMLTFRGCRWSAVQQCTPAQLCSECQAQRPAPPLPMLPSVTTLTFSRRCTGA